MSVTMDNQRPPLQAYPSNNSQGRPRSKSGFSIHSDSTGKTKHNLTETQEEKEKRKISGKSNPNAAMTELQPVAAALEKPTLGSLRSLSYNDQYGNPIVEPDRSNPTRPRWERPLETIRSFDAAIDAEYKNKQVNARYNNDNQSEAGYQSRRTSSYWGGGYDSARQQRYSSYGNGSQYGGNRDSYVEGQRLGFRPQNRQASDSQLNRYPYGGPVQPHSRDTIATGSGSASGSEPWASGTDPTNSENSSIDRVSRDTGHPDYPGYGNGNAMSGANGPYRGGAPIAEDGPYGYTSYQGGANHYFASHDQPPVPPKHQEVRPIISLGGAPGAAPLQQSGSEISRPPLVHSESLKRKSWLRRRLSGRG